MSAGIQDETDVEETGLLKRSDIVRKLSNVQNNMSAGSNDR